MRRADRLIALVDRLKRRRLTRAEDLAEALEVSVRTVYRDIAALQAHGLAIEGQAGVGYMVRGPVTLPALAFNHDQMEALALGLAFVEQVGDPDLAAAARDARRKIDAVWAAPAGSPLAHARLRTRQPEQRQAPKSAGGLRRAIRARLVVELDYEDAGGARTRRALEPLSLLSLTQGWLLIGWCRLRRDFRTFRLDRMRALRVTDETFEDHPKRNLAAYFETRGMIAPREA